MAAHPDSCKHHQYNLADHQRGTCTLRGIRRRFVLKLEGLARIRNTLKRRPRVATVKLYDRDGPLGHKRPASTFLFVF